jgi:O-antigen/teichoic acid export membrane protein
VTALSAPAGSRRLHGAPAYFVVAAATQIGFFLGRYLIAAIVSPATFGRFDAVLSLGTLLGIALALGLQGSVGHYLAFHHDDEQLQRTYLSSALAVQLACALVFCASIGALCAALGSTGRFIGFSRSEWFAAALVSLAASSALLPTAALLSRRTRAPILVSNLLRLAAIAALIAAIAGAASLRTVLSIAWGWWLGGVVQLAVLVVACRSLIRFSSVTRRATSDSIRYGAAALTHAASGWVLIASDRVVLNSRVPAEDLGRYGLAYLLAFSYEQLFNISNQLALPGMYKMLRDEQRWADLAAAIRASVVGVAAISGAFVAVGPLLLTLVAPDSFGDIRPLIAVLGCAVFWSGGYLATVNVLFFHRKVALLALTTAGAAVVGVVPIFLFASRYGVISAAWATVAGYFVHYLSVAVLARRELPGLTIAFPVCAGLAVTLMGLSQTHLVHGAAAPATFAAGLACLVALVARELGQLGPDALRRLWDLRRGALDADVEAADVQVPSP